MADQETRDVPVVEPKEKIQNLNASPVEEPKSTVDFSRDERKSSVHFNIEEPETENHSSAEEEQTTNHYSTEEPQPRCQLPTEEEPSRSHFPMEEKKAVQRPSLLGAKGAVTEGMSQKEVAVCLRHAYKSYGRGANVLNNLNMTVHKGSIYGLLGPSGCGKTTLLRCVVGLLKLNDGEVTVLGSKPGTKGSGVPGPRIGYMPQDVALVAEFDVKGVIYYFGWLFGMGNSQIKERYLFLKKLLQLPPGGQLVKSLSGGQQRRVSFAAALVQSPELLILDEPTVGLDPVLRQSIWDYLVEISQQQHTTIIITTHYIEEAKQADVIGLLRGGTLLAETSPNLLLSQHNTTSLEQVFLTLSQKQAYGEYNYQPITVVEDQGTSDSGLHGAPKQEFPLVELNSTPQKLAPIYRKSHLIPMKALLYKNFTKILNTYGGLFFLFVFPILEVMIFFSAVGKDPRGLVLGVVNDELGDCNTLMGDPDQYSGAEFMEDDLCHLHGLSCPFMDALNDGTITDHVYYADIETALQQTKAGHTVGTIYIPQNFSTNLQERVRDGRETAEEAIENSEISIWLDMSDFTGLAVKRHVYRSYENFADMMASSCKMSVKLTHIPFQFNKPIYGTKDPIYTYFLAPGIIITLVFFLCTTMTISIVAVDRAEQSWDRNLVAGVTSTMIVISHLLAQCVCLLIQMVEILVLSFLVFGMTCKGNTAEMLLLVFLQGLSGVTFGMVICVASKNLTTAAYIGMGSFYPFILSSGMLWPLEGMPKFLRYISECLPSTWATTSLRNIVDKGWGLLHPQVYPGFLISTAWIIGQSLLCFLLLRLSK